MKIWIPEGVTIRLNSLPVDALKEDGCQLYWGAPAPPPECKTDNEALVCLDQEQFLALVGKGLEPAE